MKATASTAASSRRAILRDAMWRWLSWWGGGVLFLSGLAAGASGWAGFIANYQCPGVYSPHQVHVSPRYVLHAGNRSPMHLGADNLDPGGKKIVVLPAHAMSESVDLTDGVAFSQ